MSFRNVRYNPVAKKLFALAATLIIYGLFHLLAKISEQRILQYKDSWPNIIPWDIYLHYTHSYQYCGYVLGGVLLLLIILQIVFSKWKRIRVFISYHLSDYSKAQELATKLQAQHILTEICYCASAKHDEILNAVRSGLSRADSMIVLPGITTSFVDAEILAASTARKAIAFIKMADTDSLPNTAYEGYPIFLYSELQKRNFYPLADYLYFIHGDFNSIISVVISEYIGFLFELFVSYLVPIAVVSILFTFAGILAWVGVAFGWSFGLHAMIFIYFLYQTLWIIIIPFTWLGVNFKAHHAGRVARQKIITGNATFAALNECLSPLSEVLQCLSPLPLPTRHNGGKEGGF